MAPGDCCGVTARFRLSLTLSPKSFAAWNGASGWCGCERFGGEGTWGNAVAFFRVLPLSLTAWREPPVSTPELNGDMGFEEPGAGDLSLTAWRKPPVLLLPELNGDMGFRRTGSWRSFLNGLARASGFVTPELNGDIGFRRTGSWRSFSNGLAQASGFVTPELNGDMGFRRTGSWRSAAKGTWDYRGLNVSLSTPQPEPVWTAAKTMGSQRRVARSPDCIARRADSANNAIVQMAMKAA